MKDMTYKDLRQHCFVFSKLNASELLNGYASDLQIIHSFRKWKLLDNFIVWMLTTSRLTPRRGTKITDSFAKTPVYFFWHG